MISWVVGSEESQNSFVSKSFLSSGESDKITCISDSTSCVFLSLIFNRYSSILELLEYILAKVVSWIPSYFKLIQSL